MLRAVAGSIAVALAMPAALAATDGLPESPRVGAGEPGEIRVAAMRTYRIVNAFPFTVDIKVHGNGPSFPHVVKVPPGGVVAIPYPDLAMKIQVKTQTTSWSPILTVPWRSGNITLPNF